MQFDNDGCGSGGCAVHPSLADAVRSQLQLSLREPWFVHRFAEIIDVKSQLRTSLQEPWFAAIIESSILKHIDRGVGTVSSQSSLSQLSQSSLTSSGGSGDIAQKEHASMLSADMGSRTMLAEGSNPLAVGSSGSLSMQDEGSNPLAVGSSGSLSEANLYWDVPCPCCLKVSPSEAAFVEHIKLIMSNRRLGANPIIKCVMRENNNRHRQLLSRWTRELNWLDSVSEFVAEMRSNCNPGSKRVHRPGGTGNNRKIKRFISECLSAAQHVGDNDSVVARQSPVVVGASLPGSFVPCHRDLDVTGSAPGVIGPSELQLIQFMLGESSDESWNSFIRRND